MCKLCDKIYHCTESVPELEDGIQIDPEGVVQLIIVHYNLHSDNFHHNSFNINFCPECGRKI